MSTRLAINRIKKELDDFKNSKDEYKFEVEVVNSNIFHLKAKMFGPPDTPYENGLYRLEIKLPDRYPFLPPKINFITKIYHCNISSITGLVCLDILGNKWSASMSLRSTLMSLLSLLQDPVPLDPIDGQVAKHFLSNKDDYFNTAHYWKLFFATESTSESRMQQHPMYESRLQEIKNHPLIMGKNLTDAELLGYLSTNIWNIEKAVNCLI